MMGLGAGCGDEGGQDFSEEKNEGAKIFSRTPLRLRRGKYFFWRSFMSFK